MTMNHYDVLEVSQTADKPTIRKAYKKLCLKYHPDKNPSPSARDKFHKINEAHEVLSDENKRGMYDYDLRVTSSSPAASTSSSRGGRQQRAAGAAPAQPAYRNETYSSYSTHNSNRNETNSSYSSTYSNRNDTYSSYSTASSNRNGTYSSYSSTSSSNNRKKDHKTGSNSGNSRGRKEANRQHSSSNHRQSGGTRPRTNGKQCEICESFGCNDPVCKEIIRVLKESREEDRRKKEEDKRKKTCPGCNAYGRPCCNSFVCKQLRKFREKEQREKRGQTKSSSKKSGKKGEPDTTKKRGVFFGGFKSGGTKPNTQRCHLCNEFNCADPEHQKIETFYREMSKK